MQARRIAAQLDTLIEAGVRHAVLSAFGCGAFLNPAARVATIYREELRKRADHFEVVAFAIFAAGYGPDNFTPFKAVFQNWPAEALTPSGDRPLTQAEEREIEAEMEWAAADALNNALPTR